MFDIRVTRGSSRATIFGETPKGRIWMRINLQDIRDTNAVTYAMRNVEAIDELVVFMAASGLYVEDR